MGGAAAAAMLTRGGTRKDHTSNGHENKAELSQKADQPAHPSDLISRTSLATTADRGLATAQTVWPVRPPIDLACSGRDRIT